MFELRDTIRRLDDETDYRYDLTGMYEATELSEPEKKLIAAMIADAKDPEEIAGELFKIFNTQNAMNMDEDCDSTLTEGVKEEIQDGDEIVYNGEHLFVTNADYMDLGKWLWVTDKEEDRYNKKASGWSLAKELVDEVIGQPDEEELDESLKDFMFTVKCNDGPKELIKVTAEDNAKAEEYAKKMYAQNHTTYADDRHNVWSIEDKSDLHEALHGMNEIEQFVKMANQIGLKTMGDVKNFLDREGDGKDILTALYDYLYNEIGDLEFQAKDESLKESDNSQFDKAVEAMKAYWNYQMSLEQLHNTLLKIYNNDAEKAFKVFAEYGDAARRTKDECLNCDPKKESIDEDKSSDIDKVKHAVDQFKGQVTVSKDSENDVSEYLLSKNISFMKDDSKSAKGKLTFMLKYSNPKTLNKNENLSGNMTVADIAKKHNVDADVIRAQVDIGKEVEKEHTDNEDEAVRIALDHLFEMPDYYDKLKKMEKGITEGAEGYYKFEIDLRNSDGDPFTDTAYIPAGVYYELDEDDLIPYLQELYYDTIIDVSAGEYVDNIDESLKEDNDAEEWEEVASKAVEDSDGFLTDYVWYTDGNKHVFVFGDSDIYRPEDGDFDWEVDIVKGKEAESYKEAQDWFDSYNGFADENLNEANYGGAFDIHPNEYFTRDDINDAAEKVAEEINNKVSFTDKVSPEFEVAESWFEDNNFTVRVVDKFDDSEYENSIHIDMRRIKRPNDLADKYSSDLAQMLVDQITHSKTVDEAQDVYDIQGQAVRDSKRKEVLDEFKDIFGTGDNGEVNIDSEETLGYVRSFLEDQGYSVLVSDSTNAEHPIHIEWFK